MVSISSCQMFCEIKTRVVSVLLPEFLLRHIEQNRCHIINIKLVLRYVNPETLEFAYCDAHYQY